MKQHLVILVLLILSFSSLLGQSSQIKTGRGTTSYVVPNNVTMEQAKNIAIERAKDDAFISEYGENLSSIQVLKTNGDESLSNYSSTTEISRQYEWLEDKQAPVLTYSTDPNTGQTVITAKVHGSFRKLNSGANATLKVFCNGIERDFRSGDTASVSVRVPEKGFVALFSREESGYAYCWLPYFNEDGHPREVKQNKECIFLSEKDPVFYEYMIRGGSPIILVTDKAAETLTLWLVFSPNPFSMPQMTYDADNEVYFITNEDLDKWYYTSARRDPRIQKNEKIVTIRKK